MDQPVEAFLGEMVGGQVEHLGGAVSAEVAQQNAQALVGECVFDHLYNLEAVLLLTQVFQQVRHCTVVYLGTL